MGKATDYAKELSPESKLAKSPVCQPKVGSRLNHVMGLSLDIDPSANGVLLQTLLPQLQKQFPKVRLYDA